MRLGMRLSKLNTLLKRLFDNTYAAAEKADGTPAEEVTKEQIQSVIQSLMVLQGMLDEIYRRCDSKGLTNTSKFGLASKLADVRGYRDRVWAMADWLGMLIDPSEYESKMAEGRAEFDRGEFEKLA